MKKINNKINKSFHKIKQHKIQIFVLLLYLNYNLLYSNQIHQHALLRTNIYKIIYQNHNQYIQLVQVLNKLIILINNQLKVYLLHNFHNNHNFIHKFLHNFNNNNLSPQIHNNPLLLFNMNNNCNNNKWINFIK